ncbi:DNA-binding protein [Coprinopsis marcescibilis]|uniref:DNA-binding protein n=1 Tax=Coprinopsis marcescibilis TaxID=230819 RepID=A0A5C3LAX6_COPMA|nr:DNA-binding protein [Coprinopsis marcescibilis]
MGTTISDARNGANAIIFQLNICGGSPRPDIESGDREMSKYQMPQAQLSHVSTQAITQTQSLAAVQALLRAGLSCITFLRNLLPEENFSESHLTTADDSVPLSSSETDSPSRPGRNKVNGFRIMTLTRGYTDEADRILNYLENGIFHALEKQYLRSFIFAIYLDSKDPTNIVEAYTFNFQYHQIPGTNAVTPVMTLGGDLQNMSLNNSGRRQKDPVADAIQNGRLPTLREVKKSVKTMMKTLIQAITHMDELPRRRFATFKLFYTDSTPEDYEPPHFQAGDNTKDKWYFMTHNLDEVPDRFSVGKINCGHHSVNLKVTSIATYLPFASEQDNAVFTGTVSRGAIVTRPEGVIGSSKEAELQEDDARNRNLVWSTENDLELGDADAEGDEELDDDLNVTKNADGSFDLGTGQVSKDSGLVGLRNDEGSIEPVLPLVNERPEAHFKGIHEAVPTRLQEINALKTPEPSTFEETQALLEPVLLDKTAFVTSNGRSQPGSLPPSNLAMELESPLTSSASTPRWRSPKTTVKVSYNPVTAEDDEMLDPETQVISDLEANVVDSIQSFSLNEREVSPESPIVQAPNPASKTPVHKDLGLKCDCGIDIEDEMCFCEGGCGRWYHVWCMGFHSAKDNRLPHKFACFDCRLKGDLSWHLIADDMYPNIMAKYKEIVTYRRAIKTFENSKKTLTPIEFGKALDEGDNPNLPRQLILRLEEDGMQPIRASFLGTELPAEFIQEVSTTIDEFGMTAESRTTNRRKVRDRKAKQRKNVQKSRYAFNKQIRGEQRYKDYFNPDQEVESRLLGLDDLRSFRNEKIVSTFNNRARGSLAKTVVGIQTQLDIDSQTQDADMDTDVVPEQDSQKRERSGPVEDGLVEDRPMKRLKISLAAGIDLAES